MQGRVIPHAGSTGADWYEGAPMGMPKEQWLAHNQQWVQDRMAEGRQIIDIGEDPASLRGSANYDMEHSEIFGSGYSNYVQHCLDDLEPLRYLEVTAH
jgi:hypothetical protein